jgi:DNA-3-methyladenine glycosylase
MGDVLSAAASMIGCRLVRNIDGAEIEVRIVETEAYHESEPGSHAHRGPKGRAITMFGRPGIAYVYLIYGKYNCLNVVTCREGEGAAVLIRAAEFVQSSGPDDLSSPIDSRKYSGPGKLSRELKIDRSLNAIDLLKKNNGELVLMPRLNNDKPGIATSTRIGLSKGQELAWRFYEIGNNCVCRLPKIKG